MRLKTFHRPFFLGLAVAATKLSFARFSCLPPLQEFYEVKNENL